jgi:NAD(P)-dependent dehydrogenase (short-subunit alcohol dehydrogenase family)
MNVLITGTSSGIGSALAGEYLKKGDHVYGISRRLNKELVSFENYHFASIDLSSHDQIKEVLPGFIEGIDHFELVVLNAGVLPSINDMRDVTMDEIRGVMNINTWANKHIIDILSKKLKKINQIVAISSGAAVSGARGWNAYALSKAALNMLINLYSKELPGTHFCTMAPGVIDSSMQDYIYGLEGKEEKFPVIKKLRSMKGTDAMPPATDIAPRLMKAFMKAREYDSGAFLDVRTMYQD